MKAFTVAAVQIAPVQGPLTAESVSGPCTGAICTAATVNAFMSSSPRSG